MIGEHNFMNLIKDPFRETLDLNTIHIKRDHDPFNQTQEIIQVKS